MQIVETPTCLHCGDTGTVEIPDDDFISYLEWVAGNGSIQTLLPGLTQAQREQIMTGTHPKCWDDMWAEQEQEDLWEDLDELEE